MTIQPSSSDLELIKKALRELKKRETQTSTCLKKALYPSNKKITLNSLPLDSINSVFSKYLSNKDQLEVRACSATMRKHLSDHPDSLEKKADEKAIEFIANPNLLTKLLRQKGSNKYLIVNMLLEKYDLDINKKIGPGSKKRPILEYAMMHSDYKMVKLLIKHGVNLNNTARNNKTTMLELGERSNRPEIKHLIAIANADDENLPRTEEKETFFEDKETDILRILKIRREYLKKKEPLDPTSLRRKIQQALIELL